MSDLQARQEASKDREAKHPDNKNKVNESPTVMDKGSQSTATGIDLDIDSTIDSLTHMLKYFVSLKERSQSKVQKASPAKEDISGSNGRSGRSTKSPKMVTFANKSSCNFPISSNFRRSEPRASTTYSNLASDQNVTMPEMDSTQFPTTGATGHTPSSSGDSAKRGGSPSKHGKKFPRSYRKCKNNRNNTYAKETESSSNSKGTSQNRWLSDESQKHSSNTCKNAHSNCIQRYEKTTHRKRSNGRQSGNQLSIDLLGPNIHGNSVQNSQNSSVSGRSFSPNSTKIASTFSDQNSVSATNEPVSDGAVAALELDASQIPRSTGTENPRQWDLPSGEISLLDSINVHSPESQQFQSFYPVDRVQSDLATPRYSNQFVPMQNRFSLLPSSSLSPFFNNYYTSPPSSIHSNLILTANLIQQYTSSYGNAYETLYNTVSSTNLYLNSIWNAAQQSSNSFNDSVPSSTSSNNNGLPTYPQW